MIKETITYRTEDGVGHSSLDAAVAHERRLAVSALLAGETLRLELGVDLAEIEHLSKVICGTQEAVAKIFAEDRKAGVAVPRSFRAGDSDSDSDSERHAAKSPIFAAPYRGRSEGAQRMMAEREFPSPGGVIIDKTDDYERRRDAARQAEEADAYAELDDLIGDIVRTG